MPIGPLSSCGEVQKSTQMDVSRSARIFGVGGDLKKEVKRLQLEDLGASSLIYWNQIRLQNGPVKRNMVTHRASDVVRTRLKVTIPKFTQEAPDKRGLGGWKVRQAGGNERKLAK